MPILDQLKRGVDRTKFEADRMLRINKVQNEIGAVKREILGVREKIAEDIVQLHKQSPLNYPEVENQCIRIDQLEAQIAEKESQIASIRNEQLPAIAVVAGIASAPTLVSKPTVFCPKCKFGTPFDATFCPNCGQKMQPGETVPPPSTVEDEASPTTSVLNQCANCGFALPGEAVFCPECGHPIAA